MIEDTDAEADTEGTDTAGAGAPAPEEAPGAAARDANALEDAVRQLREDAERLEQLPLDDSLVSAAERVAEAAVQLDEQIGSAARKDDH